MNSRPIIDVRITHLRQLFNTLDATPFPDKDLDSGADEFIYSWAQEFPRNEEVRIRIFVAEPTPADMTPAEVAGAVRTYYAYRAGILQRQFRDLLARGYVSLVIGLACLAVSIVCAELVDRLSEGTLSNILREGLIIGGWVAMWGPLQILLYDWWPLRNRRRVCERLASAEVAVFAPTPLAETGSFPGINNAPTSQNREIAYSPQKGERHESQRVDVKTGVYLPPRGPLE